MTAHARVDALTGVRGIAAWLVVLYHIRFSLPLPPAVIAALGKGYLAVDLFFVLSGFVLWLTWERRFAQAGTQAVAPFLAKRIARVWPLHLAVLGATVAFALVIQLSGRAMPPPYRWSELPLHIVLLQNWGFTDTLRWNGPSWSISVELAAYLGFAAWLCLIGRARSHGRALPVAVAILLIALLDRSFAWRGAATLGAEISRLGLLRCLVEFACGVAACQLWQRTPSRILIAGSAIILATAIGGWTAGMLRETLAVPIGFTALVPLLAATSSIRGNPLSSRLALSLGETSYSTYLGHYFLWSLFKVFFVSDLNAVPLPVIGLYLTMTLVAAVLLHRFVEVPGRRLSDWRGFRSRAKPRAEHNEARAG